MDSGMKTIFPVREKERESKSEKIIGSGILLEIGEGMPIERSLTKTESAAKFAVA